MSWADDLDMFADHIVTLRCVHCRETLFNNRGRTLCPEGLKLRDRQQRARCLEEAEQALARFRRVD